MKVLNKYFKEHFTLIPNNSVSSILFLINISKQNNALIDISKSVELFSNLAEKLHAFFLFQASTTLKACSRGNNAKLRNHFIVFYPKNLSVKSHISSLHNSTVSHVYAGVRTDQCYTQTLKNMFEFKCLNTDTLFINKSNLQLHV